MIKTFNRKLFWRKLFLIAYDAIAVILSSGLALMFRFDFIYEDINVLYIETAWDYLPINILTVILIFYIFRLYNSLWSFAGVEEMQNTIAACIAASFLQLLGMYFLKYSMPRSYYFIFAFVLTILTLVARFSYRFIRVTRRKVKIATEGKNTLVVGAGEAGNMLISELMSSEHLELNIKCVIDDSKNKIGSYIHGIKVVGDKNTIPFFVDYFNIELIIIAMPSVSKKVLRSVVEICKETKCELKTLPGMYQLVTGEVWITKLRNIDIEDLLGRDPITVNLESVMGYVKGKTVLITGGGGSIGSELCRQISANKPKRLIIVDIYENNAYDIEQELKRTFPELDLVVLIASVRNELRLEKIFSTYKPNIVYHAAAHKHVPLMETSPNEAIKNNVLGTFKTAKMADKFEVEKFVLISTDKAVNPTNIMGASKRICEMIVQSFNGKSKTEFVAVRFGNVLGSNGSVIPLFKKQIEAGGPITVTHPDIVRYFMTIPEAVSLVLQAGAYAKGGEIFVLDMGEQIKILDLAENLIKLSGYTPNEDIKITFTGLRPGEKLYEELLMDEEGLEKTENESIYIGRPIEIEEEVFWNQIEELKLLAESESSEIRNEVEKIVKTYVIQEVN